MIALLKEKKTWKPGHGSLIQIDLISSINLIILL